VTYRKQIYVLIWLVGLVIISLGLNTLHDIFSEESHRARADIETQQNTLNKYAVKSLRQNLHNRLKFSQFNVNQIAKDPLIPDQGFLVIQQGEQILPRSVQHLKQSHNPAIQLYHWIKDIDPLDLIIENANSWDQRLNLLSHFKLAIDNGDNNEIRWAFRAIREHRSQSTLEASRDIPFMLAVIDYFIEHSNPSKRLLQGIIRNGSIVEQENNIHGLQRSLLNYRNTFTRADFIFLRDRILILSRYLNVTYADFLQQSELQTQKVSVDNIKKAGISFSDNWYIEPLGEDEVIGITIDIDKIIMEIFQEMIQLGLISISDRIIINKNENKFIQLENIKLDVQSEMWQKKYNHITELYWLKTSLLIITALLAIISMALTGIVYYRKNRLLTLKSDFVSTISHELKTPLASLRLLTETLTRKEKRKESISKYPGRIITIIDELTLLIDNILSFNRINKGNWQAKFETINFANVIQDVKYELLQYNISAENRNFQLKINTNPNTETSIFADPALLKMLFRNLFSNSLKYNDSKQAVITIDINIEKVCEITYQDNGIGIPKNQYQIVFEEFSRIVNKEKSVSGTGLGLTICRMIMSIHNGSINIIENNEPGTCFRMLFPLPNSKLT